MADLVTSPPGTSGAVPVPENRSNRYADDIVLLTKRRLQIFADAGDDWRFAESLRAISEDAAQEYEDRALIELLQNGHDALDSLDRGRVRVVLDLSESPGSLYVANDGRPFTRGNFRSITEVALSDKAAGEGIGNKGLGFRSVLDLSQRPEIYSRDPNDVTDDSFRGYSFRFARREDIRALIDDADLASRVETQVSPLALPVPAAIADDRVRALGREGFATVVKLPLRDAAATEAARSQTATLADADAPLLLFLERLSALEVSIVDEAGIHESQLTRTETHPALLPCDSPSWVRQINLGSQGTYLVARRDLQPRGVREAVVESVAAHKVAEAWLDWDGEGWVGVALRTDSPLARGQAYTFLPMGPEASAPLAAHVHAPFFTKLARRAVSLAVPLNAYLIREIASLCLDLSRLLRETGEFIAVAPFAVDLCTWFPPHHLPLVEASAQLATQLKDEPFVPLAAGAEWASLGEAYVWPQRHEARSVLTADRVCRAGTPIVDPAIGHSRLVRLAALHDALVGRSMEAQPSDIAAWTEGVAQALHSDKEPLEMWARYYDDLAAVFPNQGALLRGKRIVLDQEETLQTTMGAESRRQQRLLFFAPSPDDDGADASAVAQLPRPLRRRLNYAHPDIPWNVQDPVRRKRPGRAFLENAGLVREYRTDRLLEVLSDLLAGDASPALRHATLQFAYALFPTLNEAHRSFLRGIRFQLPTAAGSWAEASTLVFSAAWGARGALLLDQLLTRLGNGAPGLSAVADRLLAPPETWPFKMDDPRRWYEFLETIGVQDGLPLDRPGLRPPQRQGTELRPSSLAAEIGLEAPLADRWAGDVDRVWSQGSHPYTTYGLSGPLTTLPGSADIGALATEARSMYAQLVLIGLHAWSDDVFSVTVSRPNRPIQNRDSHEWPTPAQSFLRHGRWLPLEGLDEEAGGVSFARPRQAWAAFAGEMPPFARPLSRPIRRLLDNPAARTRLESAGLNVWEDWKYSGRLLRHLATILGEDGIPEHLTVNFKRHYRRAWEDLMKHPELWPWKSDAEPILVVMEGARLRSLSMTKETAVYVPNDEDPAKRTLLELSGRPVLVIEPEDGAAAVALLTGKGFTAAPTAQISLDVYGDDHVVIADPELPRLVEGPPWLSTVVGLVVELRAGQFSRRGERGMRATMETLHRIRVARPSTVRLVIDGHEVTPPDTTTSLPIQDDAVPTIVVWRQGSIWDELEAAAGSLAQLLNQASLADALRATFMSLARLAGDDPPDYLDDATLARALNATEDEVREHRQGLRGPLIGLLERLRAIVWCYGGMPALDSFSDATRSATDESFILAGLDTVGGAVPLPLTAPELMSVCRDSATLADVRDRLGIEFRLFNDALAALDPPHAPLVHPERHLEALNTFVDEHRGAIIDRLRELFLPVAVAGGDLVDYGEARTLSALTPDPTWLREYAEPPHDVLLDSVQRWLRGLGALDDLAAPTDLPHVEDVRRVNFETLSRVAARADTLTRTWSHRAGVARADPWDTTPVALARSALETSFACDFVELSEERLLHLVATTLGWPPGMPETLALVDLDLAEVDLLGKEAHDENDRQRRLRERTHIRLDGRELPVGADNLAALTEAANASVTDGFLAQNGKVVLSIVPGRASSHGGERGAPRTVVGRIPRLSDDQREAVGLIGEVVAQAWLERRYSDVTWVSGFRSLVLRDGKGSDSLGYDFEARHGRRALYFEVKAVHSEATETAEFDLGETEIRAAQQHARGDAYRILLVTAALDTSARRIYELPNPLSRKGLDRYTLLGRGLRYRCSFGQ